MNPIVVARAKIAAGAVVLAALIVSAWYLTIPKSQPTGATVVAKEDKRVEGTPTVSIPTPHGVRVLIPAAKQQLNLPADQQNDSTHQVTAAAILPAQEAPESAIAVLDVDTGRTEILAQKLEPPLIASEQRGQIWAGYGFKNGGIKVGRLSYREDLVQIRSVHLGVNATLDTDGSYFVGGGVAYRW